MSKNEEIAGFLRQRMVAEMKRFHEFADNMNGRAYYGGSIFVQFKDGTTDEYLLRPEDWQDVINFAQTLCTMRKYHVAVEQIPNSSIMGMFGGPMGFSVIYFTCEIPEGQPVNRDTLYELINRERDEKHKTGNVIAWSKIETE